LKYRRLWLSSLILICIAFLAHSQDDSMDPVARQLLESMDAPSGSVAVGSYGSAQSSGQAAAARSVSGNWNMELMTGEDINLTLSQSDSMVFGSGMVMSGAVSKPATASGSLFGNILKLNVVPMDGTKLYALSLDLGGQTPAKTYSIFGAGTATLSGTVRRVSYSTYE
jgi:hypothetical protein